MSEFVPKIIAFCCDQSGYPAADMAGTFKLKLPENVEIVRVPCAGRIETIYLLKALEKGADGVLIFGCYEENCQYLRGNLRAKSRLFYAQQMLGKIGLEKERMEILSSCDQLRGKVCRDASTEIRGLEETGTQPGKNSVSREWPGDSPFCA